MNQWGMWRTAFILSLVCAVGIGIGIWLGSLRTASPPPTAHSAAEKKDGPAEPEGTDASLIKLSAEQKQMMQLKIEPVALRISEETLSATGRIVANPDRTVLITPRTSGRVIQIDARLGQNVKAGEVMALLDSVEAAEALAELAQNESTLALAQVRADKEKQLYKAKLQVLEVGQRQESAAAAEKTLAQVELGRLKQDYLGALARLELAQANHERQQLLVEKKIGARKDLIEAEKVLITARGEWEAVGETIRISARQELLSAETALHQARSQRDKMREKLRLLGYSGTVPPGNGKSFSDARPLLPLVAPFGGTVIDRQVAEGQLIEPGFAAFHLADLDTLWALLDVPETEAGRIGIGQQVTIESKTEGGKGQTGRVAFIGDVVDEQTRTLKVRVELPNSGRLFKPGMFITARINTLRSGGAEIQLPTSAVFLFEDVSVVFVEGDEGIILRPVETTLRWEGRVAIRKGLRVGERVVTEGGFALKAHLLKSKMGEDDSHGH
jgi:cobalt-zinc-cadmium efflux system membrane fusion protein